MLLKDRALQYNLFTSKLIPYQVRVCSKPGIFGMSELERQSILNSCQPSTLSMAHARFRENLGVVPVASTSVQECAGRFQGCGRYVGTCWKVRGTRDPWLYRIPIHSYTCLTGGLP